MDPYGKLKHDHPLWRIRHFPVEVPSGPSRTVYVAERGGVKLTDGSVGGLREKITDTERAHGWGERP